MGAVKQYMLKAREKQCPECYGIGQVEYEVEKPHAGGFNRGYIDTAWGDCDECKGEGTVPLRCEDCGEVLTNADDDGTRCNGCMEEYIHHD